MKKMFKSAISAITGVMLTLSMSMVSLADGDGGVFDLSYLEKKQSGGMFDSVTESFQDIFSSFYGLIGVATGAIALVCLILIGLKMMRGGRHSEMAKDEALNWIIGACIIFGAISIVTTFIGLF